MTSSNSQNFQWTWTVSGPPPGWQDPIRVKLAPEPDPIAELIGFVIARLDETHAALKRAAPGMAPSAGMAALRAIMADRAIAARCLQVIDDPDSPNDQALAEHVLMDMARRWQDHAHYEPAWTL